MWDKLVDAIKKTFSTIPIEKMHVICCNDFPQHVFIGTEKAAIEKMDELAKEYYDSRSLKFQFKEYKDYRFRYYWHIQSVKYSIEGGEHP